MKKLLSAVLVALVAFAPSAFANSMSGNVTANVPSTCEIRAVTDVHAEFGFNVSSTTGSGNILVACNLDANYTLTSPTVDAAGRFTLPSISGHPGAEMEVELRDNTGVPLTSSGAMNRVGTGQSEWVPFSLNFNPAGLLPPVAFYQGTLTFDLTAAL